MLCDECKRRPASVHITKITNNHKVEKHLCQQCAQASGEGSFSFGPQFSVHDFLKGMFNHGFAEGHIAQSQPACTNCGMTYQDFSRTGRIGCSACYGAFGQRLEPLLRRIHGASIHTGKLPKRAGGQLELKQRLKRLRQDLERHVANEEYEQAARVRDEIRSLEKQLSSQS
ncbi:UvrB/UvrC protein [Thermosinus carboxydivorans Nor1]|uniref:UvrB/UvrC protein n=1 Tax=Thermosinus carboxydivorans Nor1 TaxID=401526 RepID=A1HTJ6_9FIRM|nr:UvrB/UvrC motif-containing protein [Thermosinus carboxydivorans]EAX46673.1 UvrB/UvrC protein [Thermosinus carboxydivorans Nor1]